jgi:hypothetical protein
MVVTSVGHDSLESMKWVWGNCPIRGNLDLDGAVGQGCHDKFDGGPHPILDYLVDECGCKITIEKVESSFSISRSVKGEKIDRTPFLNWVENKGFVLKKNRKLIEKARRLKLADVTEWLEN